MKTGLQQAGEILTLIGAILTTVGWSILMLITLFLLSLPAILIIVFLWVTRTMVVKKKSKGWNIFGIVFTVIVFDWISLAGYICLLIDYVNKYENINTDNTDNNVTVSE
ncbi:MAG: hypothetical protein ACK5HS_04910 [Mycoplasmatales bacterium]